MEAAIVGAILSGTLPMLLSIVRDKCREEEADVQSIIRKLHHMQFKGTIRHPPPQRPQARNYWRRAWIAQLIKLGDDLQDCMDRFQAKQITSADQYKKEIQELNKTADSASTLLDNYFNEVASTSSSTRQVAGDDLLALVQGQSQNQSGNMVKVIAVVGSSSLNNTNGARKVYDNVEVLRQFSRRAWVNAAGRTEDEVLREIHRQVGEHIDMPLLTLTQVKDGLESFLSNDRCLVVIHDVDTEELYDGIMSSLSWTDDRADSRIIMMTAIRSAVVPCSCGDNNLPHAPDMSTLSRPWVGEVGNVTYREVCFKLCADYVERTQWSIASDYESVVLEDLLLYFSMFPHHHYVRRNALIRRWLAEGLLAPELDQVENIYSSPQDVAAKHLNSLIGCNFIESSTRSNNGKVKRCQPPGMVFNYICSRATVKNFNILLCCRTRLTAERQPGYVRRLSLHPHSDARNGGLLMPDVRCLRTMLVFSTGCGYFLSFDNPKLLRVLDLKECADVENAHLERICELLRLLKYLSLGNSISRVPRKIRRLHELETLQVRTTDVVEVYSEVLMMPKLKHLLGKFQFHSADYKNISRKTIEQSKLKEKPQKLVDFLKRKSVLETLAGFIVHDGKGIPQFFCYMGHLRKVKIWCGSTAIKEIELTDLKEGIKDFCRRGSLLPKVDFSLSIHLNGCSQSFLDFLGYDGRFTSLKLTGDLAQFGLFDLKLSSLQELCLSMTNLTGAAIQSGLSNLNCGLKFLKLVETNLGGLTMQQQQPFASLQRICLVGMDSLVDINIQDLTQLVSLHLICKNLGDLPNVKIRSLTNLAEVGLHPDTVDTVQQGWEVAAMGHRRKPKVVSIETP